MELTDILPLEKWVELEKEIRALSGLDANVFDVNGIRITDYKAWSNDLCPVIKANEKGQTFICAAAHQNIAAMAQQARKPVVEECDAGMVKIVAPIYVGEEFLGGAGGCGLVLEGEGEVETFLVNMTTGLDEEKIAELARSVRSISRAKAEETAAFIAERIDRIVSGFLGSSK